MKTIFVLIAALLFLWGCASTPNPYPLDGTTWVYVNRRDGERSYTLSYTTDTVTFTIFNKNGSVAQEPIQGTYTLSGETLTEVYGDYTSTSAYSARRIVDSLDTTMVFTIQPKN